MKYKVQFVGFSAANAKSSITGGVKVDGATARSVPPANQVTWSGNNGTLAGSVPGTAGAASTVVSKFKWLEGTTWRDEPARSVKTGVCADTGIAIGKRGPATRYVGDDATFTYAVENTGNVTHSSPEVRDDKCAPVTRVPGGRMRGKRGSSAVRVTPNRYGFGRHRLVARVTFSSGSGTKARTLRLTFRRCAPGAIAPRFTG